MADDELRSEPGTEPFAPDFDTASQRFKESAPEREPAETPGPYSLPSRSRTEPPLASAESGDSATPVQVPSRYQYAQRWKLLLVILAVWIAAAQVGLSLFYWWYHTPDKTAVLFVLLVYIVACAVGGSMLSMVPGRSLITALSLGVMSGPFASVVAAAPLYGYYSCERASHCLIGLIPY